MIKSFKYAFSGIRFALRERNMRIILIIFALTATLGLVVNLSVFEWTVILVCSALVIGTEILNSAIEITIDLFTNEYNTLAKKAKDLAAGATLLFCIFSVAVGLIIFTPYIIRLFGGII